MKIIFNIITVLYYISLYLGLLLLIVVIPLWVVNNLNSELNNWKVILIYTSLTAVYIEITDKYFKLNL